MECTSCGAQVVRTDRFCPACGTPNLDTSFHPKLDRGRVVEDPYAVGPVREGPSCPRCGGGIRRREGFCRRCGLQLDEVWVALDRAPVDGVWTTPGPHNLDPYRSSRLIAAPLVILLGVGSVLAFAGGTFHLWAAARLGGDLSGTSVSTTSLLEWARRIDLVGAGLVLLGGVLLLAWMNRAYRNLVATGVTNLRFRPYWATLGWFVPLANLVIPKLIVDDLWRASDPLTPPRSAGWRVIAAPVWSGVWWALMLLGGAVGVLGVLAMPGWDAASNPDLRSALLLMGTAAILLGAAGLALLTVVRRTTDRQEVRVAMLGAPDVIRRFQRKPAAEEAGVVNPTLVRPAVTPDGPVWGKY